MDGRFRVVLTDRYTYGEVQILMSAHNFVWALQWLWGDNSVNILGMVMVLVHCTSSHCHLSINQVSFQSLLYFSRYGPDKQP